MYGCDLLPNRLAFLASLLDYQIVDLPPVKPLSRQALVEKLQASASAHGIYCHSKDPNECWRLRLSKDGELVVHQLHANTTRWCAMVRDGARWCAMVRDGARWCAMVRDDNFDEKGRLVIDGHVALTRAMM